MADSGGEREKVPVVIICQEDFRLLRCDHFMTLAEVRQQWSLDVGRESSVAFFTQDNQYLTDDVTVGEARGASRGRSLELTAFPKSVYWLQVFGFEETNTRFEVAAILTPAVVRREIGRAVGIYTDDYRLTWGDVILDPELPFNEQGLVQGAELTVDLRVNVRFNQPNAEESTVECYGSDRVGDLRQRLELDDDTVLVSTSPHEPHRRVLDDLLHVCNVSSDPVDLAIPIHLDAERKVVLNFQPVDLDHLRQQLPIALSLTPRDLHDTIRERFQITTEFRFFVNEKQLDNSKPLTDQGLTIDDVIQIDILRPFVVHDLWPDLLEANLNDEVYLYSTDSAHALYLRDELNDQRLFFNNFDIAIFGSARDVFGPTRGREKAPLLIDRDVHRSIATLSFNVVERKLGWAKDLLLDVVSSSKALPPQEIMWSNHLLPGNGSFAQLHLSGNSLMITDPDKVFISSEKKLSVFRFACGSTYGDVRSRVQQWKGCLDMGLETRDHQPIQNEAMDRKMDKELFLLNSASRFQTKLTVTMNGQWYACWFEPQQVSFSDVMVSVGKQAKLLPRHLFSRKLFCLGCGRKISKKEEPHQAIPATCCSVRSLRLTDRRIKDVGVQTATPRRREVETYTLDTETRDVEVQTATPRRREAETYTLDTETRDVNMDMPAAPTRPCMSIMISTQTPEGELERRIVSVDSGSNCRGLLAAADRQLVEVLVGDSPLSYVYELTYDRCGQTRKAVRCFKEESKNYIHIDYEDSAIVDSCPVLSVSRRFLRPSSRLPVALSFPVAVFIRTDAELLMTDSRRRLSAAPGTALTDPAFVAWMRGIRSGAQYFWELSGDFSFADAESGRVVSIREIPAGPKRFVGALLRDKDPVPRTKVPEGRVLFVLRRTDFELWVEGGCVRCAGPLHLDDIERWDVPRSPEAFDKDFTAAACRL